MFNGLTKLQVVVPNFNKKASKTNVHMQDTELISSKETCGTAPVGE